MKSLNFENWSSGELSKIGHHFRKYKNCGPKFVFFNKKIDKDSDDFWCRKLTLKVKFWHFLTPSHYTNSQNSIISFDYSWFLGKNLSNFIYPDLKLHNLYCHTGQPDLAWPVAAAATTCVPEQPDLDQRLGYLIVGSKRLGHSSLESNGKAKSFDPLVKQ